MLTGFGVPNVIRVTRNFQFSHRFVSEIWQRLGLTVVDAFKKCYHPWSGHIPMRIQFGIESACLLEVQLSDLQLQKRSFESGGYLTLLEADHWPKKSVDFNIPKIWKKYDKQNEPKTVSMPPSPCSRFHARWHTWTPKIIHSVAPPWIPASETMSFIRSNTSTWFKLCDKCWPLTRPNIFQTPVKSPNWNIWTTWKFLNETLRSHDAVLIKFVQICLLLAKSD